MANNIKQVKLGGTVYDIVDTNGRAMIADEYSETVEYKENDFCTHEDKLMRCIEDTTGVFDDSKWTLSNVSEMLKYVSTGASYTGVIGTVLSEDWVLQEDGTYVYEYILDGVTASDLVNVSLYDDGTAFDEQKTIFNEYIVDIETVDGKIVFVAKQRPEVLIQFMVRGSMEVGEVYTDTSVLIEVSNKYDALSENVAQINENLVNHINNTGVDLLWTNPNPSSNFAEQTLNISMSPYSLLLVCFLPYKTWGEIMSTCILPCQQGFWACASFARSDSDGGSTRNVKVTDLNTLTFGDGAIAKSGADNGSMIPYKIYGIKLGG